MNGILLCAGCHRFVAHVDYEEIRSLVIRKIGVEAFQGLRIRAMTITKADEAMAIITLKCLISEGKKNNAGMQGISGAHNPGMGSSSLPPATKRGAV